MKKRFGTLRRYFVFFLLISYVITCCMMLFLSILFGTLNITMSKEQLRKAAIPTFGNVVFLSVTFTVIDEIRRKLTVERHVRRIVGAAQRITGGDFSVRIEPIRGFDDQNGFNEIIRHMNIMARELSGIETLRTDFIANVSHELKTPLAVLQNYGTLLQQPGLSEERRIEYAKTISGVSGRLADLITNILKLNRLENQRIYPEKQTYDLGEQLCECLLNFERVWEEKQIDIVTDIEDEVLIENDPELLSLVWSNLFSNALKFTDSGGRVSLSLKTEDNAAVVSVSDTGCGISSETGRHIFEKFYQGETSHATQGNGLGLALVKRVTDIVGGEISVSSEVGKGSTFTVRIRRRAYEVQADTP